MHTTQLDATNPAVTKVVVIVLLAWFAAVLLLGELKLFVSPPGTAPLPIFFGAVMPIIVFLAGYFTLNSSQDFTLSLDQRLAVGIQAWRAGGIGFLAMYVHGVLPGIFAWPAGMGDIAIGVTAPWIVLALIRRPEFAYGKLFIAWNLFGILDLVLAVSLGAMNSALATGVPGEITTAPMTTLPLVIIPAFLVPLFIMLHLAAIFQSRIK